MLVVGGVRSRAVSGWPRPARSAPWSSPRSTSGPSAHRTRWRRSRHVAGGVGGGGRECGGGGDHLRPRCRSRSGEVRITGWTSPDRRSRSRAVQFPALAPYGWNDRWAPRLAEFPECLPGRVVRHDGSGLLLAGNDGVFAAPLERRLDPAPTVGDWIAYQGLGPVAVLPGSPCCAAVPPKVSPSRRWRPTSTSCSSCAGSTVRCGRGASGGVPPSRKTPARCRWSCSPKRRWRPIPTSSPRRWAPPTPASTCCSCRRSKVSPRCVAPPHHTPHRHDAGRIGGGEVEPGQRAARGRRRRDRQGAGGDAKGRHTTTTRELPCSHRRRPHRQCRHPGGRALGRSRGRRRDLHRHRGSGRRVSVRRLRPRLRTRFAVTAGIEAGALPADRLDAWHAFHREADAAALRAQPHERRRRDSSPRIPKARATPEGSLRRAPGAPHAVRETRPSPSCYDGPPLTPPPVPPSAPTIHKGKHHEPAGSRQRRTDRRLEPPARRQGRGRHRRG